MNALPEFVLDILDYVIFAVVIAWLTVLPSIGVLWLVGALS